MSTNESLRREAGTVEENAVRIDTDKAEQVIEALNTDLAATYVLYHQLRKHHWNVAGAEFEQLHDWFGDAAEDAEDNADDIAERVQALGGVPISGPSALSDHAPVEFEGEDVYNVRTSMENDLAMYGEIIETVREHISLAEDLGDYATSEILRDTLEDLEDDAHELEHFLEDDTLVLEAALN
ncbi:DNA starvation/stationary phase protection protein DpsA [Halopenitus persicus]|uniref:DNA-binding ferritin-like protein (Oxidative damage protectant) n=1 Tax=Halopenitus persicus TaxID=1048396 RepID=A0A1H3M9E6_9EURY|nr:DNA starvation/stationary phase protection protein DpsA [Halopenitus persicus]QHS16551.1 DNA starvation/stationary phase protection protein [haloarchaeon 3A1-DGR]SDY73340.1 DNA-binding ferritin-like protein (oxidative damage protectant) [Halopenitus persicus]